MPMDLIAVLTRIGLLCLLAGLGLMSFGHVSEGLSGRWCWRILHGSQRLDDQLGGPN